MNRKKIIILCSLSLVTACTGTDISRRAQSDVQLTDSERALLNSEAWLAANLRNEGVVETQSGLQYKIIQPSQGCAIDATQAVNVHYESVFPETGLVFDSSYQRGYSSTFPLNKVIVGWTEGVASMKVGEVRELYVHPKLAYGERGSLPVIKPNVVTQYKIQLINGTCI